MIDPDNPPEEVKKWMKRLHRCLKDAPPGIWLFATGDGLYVMASDDDNKPVMNAEFFGVDAQYIIRNITEKIKLDVDGGGF